MATSDLIRRDELKRLLHYDPETGVFTRLASAPNAPAGTTAGSDDGEGYLKVRLNGRTYKCHRLAWFYVIGKWPAHKIDHENGIRSDNRFDNLRDATQQFNLQNQRVAKSNNKSTGVLGVYRQGNYITSSLKVNDSVMRFKGFKTVEEAHAFYVWMKRFWHQGCTI